MRLRASFLIAGLGAFAVAARPAWPAEPAGPAPVDASAAGFVATCEDLGRFCFADACGRDQIEAAQGCRARCPSAVIVSVVPTICPTRSVVLRRRG